MKKITAIILSAALLLQSGMVPHTASAQAQENQIEADGTLINQDEVTLEPELSMEEAPQGWQLDSFETFSLSQNRTASNTYRVSNSIQAKLENGVLTISGSGEIPDYETSSPAPWYANRSQITSIVIEAGITYIGKLSFYGCTMVNGVSFPNTLDMIGEAAFYQCEKLESITLPDSLKTIGVAAFYGNTSLKQIQFGKGLKSIEEYAFQATGMTQCDIPEGVTSMGDYVFCNSNKLISIGLPASLKQMGANIALNSPNVETISVNANNTVYQSKDGILYSKNGKDLFLFPNGKKIETYAIPDGTVTIKECAFQKNQYLKQITFPKSVTTMEDWCFNQSQSLESVTVPSNVTSMGDGPFQDCPKLKTADIQANITATPYVMFSGCTSLETVKLSDSIVDLYLRTFYNCTSLKNVTVSKKIDTIRVYAFFNCTSLTSFTMGEQMQYIQAGAFTGCSNLKIEIPSYMTEVSEEEYRTVEQYSISGTNRYKEAYEVLDLVNAERAKEGLDALTMDQELLEAAMLRAAETRILFSHTRPVGSDCFSVSEKAIGENIALGYTSSESVMKGWMNSSGHKANILGAAYQSVGIGCFMIEGRKYWAQLFTNQRSNAYETTVETKAVSPKIMVMPSSYECVLKVDESKIFSKGTSLQVIAELRETETNNLVIQLKPEDFNWTSSNTSVATVDSKGIATAKGYGKAVITAALKDTPFMKKTLTLSCDSEKWVQDTNGWYYMIGNQKIKNQWKLSSGKWYYLGSDGYMLTNSWLSDNNKRYYLSSTGAMVTGWKQLDGIWYYMKSGGDMAYGWVQSSGVWYYMNQQNGYMEKNQWIQSGAKWYYVGSNGVMKTNSWVKAGWEWFYMGASGALKTDSWIYYGKVYYYVKSDGRMAADEWIGKYYVDRNGVWTKTQS